jgi:hypothetical protein
MAVDYQNVGIISDYDVVPLLAELTNVVNISFVYLFCLSGLIQAFFKAQTSSEKKKVN